MKAKKVGEGEFRHDFLPFSLEQQEHRLEKNVCFWCAEFEVHKVF